jgi:very-short-patch-repair endonuclease
MRSIYNDNDIKLRRADLRNNTTKPEQVLWYWLRGKNLNGYKFRRQYSVGRVILDFYCPKLRLGIEIDGDSHFSADAVIYDRQREDFLKQQGIKIIRFTNRDVIDNIEGVVREIQNHLS